MKRGVWIAGALALAVLGWRAARRSPPASVSGVRALEEVLASRDDNNPRLDRDFNALSAEDKAAFRKKYREIPAERRNERGTIVYLLGKNMASAEDWAFLREVAGEPPCRSLADCAKPPAGESEEGGVGDDVTLAYPSLVALKQAERALDAGTSAAEAKAVIAAGLGSKMPAVARLAAKLDRRFPR